MQINELNLTKHKKEIINKWANASDVGELLLAWQIPQEEFIEKYASGIFDHLLAVLEGRQSAGDCPKLMLLMEFLASKIVSVGDIFALCIRFRHIIGESILTNCFLGQPCREYHQIIVEIHSFFDLNLRGALDRYFETLYIKEQEVKNLTEKNRLQEELITVQSRQAVMGEMIAAIAHQWRQPLNVILMDSSEIGDLLDNNEELNILLASIQKQVRYMNETIADFRNFFKPLDKYEDFLLKDAISSVLMLIEKQYKKYGIEFEISCSDTAKAKGRLSEIVQLLLMLFSNAKDAIIASKAGGGKIALALSEDEQNLKLCVKDSGVGISDEIFSKLFAPYSTTKSDGTGIGLYIAKQIAQKNGGDLEAKNSPKGAEFCINLHKSI